MSVVWTTAAPASAELQDACGLPLGLVAQPLASPDGSGPPPPPACWASDLARCARCQAYINALCEADGEGWACALCGCANDFSSANCLRRYYGRAGGAGRASLPELSSPVVDVLCPLVAADPDEGVDEVLALEAQPAVLAVVDACCAEEGLELVRSSLAAAVEGLPAGARFGLVSFGSQLTLHPVRGGNGGPVRISLAGPSASQASIQEAAPLSAMLAPVGSCRQSILAALEGLEAEPPVGGGRERALGDALRAVLRWIAVGAPAAAAEGTLAEALQRQLSLGSEGGGGEEGEGPASLPAAQSFPGMRLLLFLSGPPNCGSGAVVSRRPSAADVAAAAKAAQEAAEQAAHDLAALALDPQYPELSAWSEAVELTHAQQRRQASQQAAAAAALAAAGDLSHAAPPGIPPGELQVHVAARKFYAEAGAAAAALGVSVDLFVACPLWTGLDLLQPLAAASGGSLQLYRSLDAAMPQDVLKTLSQPRALACLLRLRCSPELELRGAHGRLVADREHPDLFHLVSCATEDAFAFDLDRSTQALATQAPAVQLVVQYSTLAPAAGLDGAPGDGSRFVLHRRMRVITAAARAVRTADQLFASCDCDALACLAVHKSLATADEQGVAEARQMLFDWLALLTAAAADQRGGGKRKPDAALADLASLHHLPHFVFALLAGPLLLPPSGPRPPLPAPWAHPDAPAALRSLLCTLPPDELAVAVCPQLSSWSSPEQAAVLQHSLSEAALAVSPEGIWVLDAFCQLIVLYRQAGGTVGPLAFPPPADSTLRRTLAGIRSARRLTPELLMLREGEHGTAPFESWLLEDARPAPPQEQQMSSGGPAPQAEAQQWPGFVTFVDAVTAEAERLLAEPLAGGR